MFLLSIARIQFAALSCSQGPPLHLQLTLNINLSTLTLKLPYIYTISHHNSIGQRPNISKDNLIISVYFSNFYFCRIQQFHFLILYLVPIISKQRELPTCMGGNISIANCTLILSSLISSSDQLIDQSKSLSSETSQLFYCKLPCWCRS